MSLKLPKRFTIISLILFALCFATLIIISFLKFESKVIDVYFRTQWILNSAIYLFFKFFIPVQALAVVLSFSLFLPSELFTKTSDNYDRKEINANITVVLSVLIFIATFFFVGNEILMPKAYKKNKALQTTTQTARTYKNQANDAFNEDNFIEAHELICKYLAIKSEDKEGLQLKNNIQKRMDNQLALADKANTKSENKIKKYNLTGKEAVATAKNYLNNGDYYSAYYYAQIALKISSTIDMAKTISTQAWTKLSSIEPSKQEIKDYSLFYQKKKGIDLLLSDKSIEAYYLFKKLNSEYPKDEDVKNYLDKSKKEANKLILFIDDAEAALSFPGVLDILFLNINTIEQIEIYSLGKMVTVEGGTYFRDIEIISLSQESGITKHLYAPYGKLVDDYIVLKAIDKDDENVEIVAEYYIKYFAPETANAVKLNYSTELIAGLSTEENLYKNMSLIELFRFKPFLTNLGWPIQPLYIEIVTRILKPCEFMLLSLFLIIISWKYRKKNKGINFLEILFLPVMFFLLVFFSNSYQYMNKIFSSWFYLNFGELTTICVLSLAQIIQFTVIFMLLARLNIGNNSYDED